jgi:diguanylate cyclase (GGDEF)-like protein
MILRNIVDTSLLGVGLIVSIVLAIAWYDFGRPAHARTWAIGFAVLSLVWAIELVSGAGLLPDRDTRPVVVLAGALGSAINTIGFRQRSGKASWRPPLIGAALLPPLLLLLIGPGLPIFLSLLPLDLFNAVMLAIAADTLIGRRRSERAAERLIFFGLIALATVSGALFLIKATALLIGLDPLVEETGRWLLPLLPATVTTIGIFTLVLLNADLADQTRRLAATDVLTGLLNRWGFEAVAQTLLDAARASGRRVTLALIDIDRFKQVNDSFGHPVGDGVLHRFAQELAARVGRRDLLSRLGGGSFALMLVDADMTRAIEAADGIRRAIATVPFGLPDDRVITASFGMAEIDENILVVGDLLTRADRALYRAKENGRNRVVAYVSGGLEPIGSD